MRLVLLAVLILLLASCGLPETAELEPTVTPIPAEWVGVSAELSLGSIDFTDIVKSDRNRFKAETFNLRSFDASQTLLLPGGDAATVAFTPRAIADAYRWSLLYDWGQPMISMGNYAFFRRSDDYPDPIPRHVDSMIDQTFLTESGEFLLRGVALEQGDSMLLVRSIWQQLGQPAPIELSLQLLTEDGQLVTEWVGLGADWAVWQTGDTLVQVSELALPKGQAEPLILKIGIGADHVEIGIIK